MKIKKFNAESFGKLKNKQIDLAPDINVIVGANESGKSSVTRFLRFMLYGFTSVRAAELSKNDKKKYTPWDDTSCKGTMEITAKDADFILRREQSARASHSITDASGVPVFQGLSGGEAILGVDAETFDKTALISSGDVFFEDAVSLSTAIKNMVFSADSAVDSDTALKKLDTLCRSILGKTERSGRLYEARGELSELIKRRTELADLHRELLGAQTSLDKVRGNIEKNNAILDKLHTERDNIDAYNALQIMKKIEAAEEKVSGSRDAYEKQSLDMSVAGFVPDRQFLSDMNEALLALTGAEMAETGAVNELKFAQEHLKNCYNNPKQFKFNQKLKSAEKTPESLAEDISVMKAEIKSLKKKAKICFCFFLLIVPIFIGLFFNSKAVKLQKELEKLSIAFECPDLAEFEYMLSGCRPSEQAAENARERLDTAKSILEQAENNHAVCAGKLADMMEKSGCAVNISDTGNLPAKAKEHIKNIDAHISKLEALENILKIDTAALDSLLDSIESLEKLKEKAESYTQEIPLRDINKNSLELDFYTRANEGLAVQEREYEKRTAVITSNMDKPDELTAKINLLTEEISELEKQHAALSMAKDAIESAHTSMRGNVSPILTEKASALFSEMTGGKYKGLYVDNELQLTFLEDGSAEYKSVDYLSSGALDAAYLSLRITLTQYLYEESPVLIFDDAFSRFDDERLARVCKMLEKLSEQYQIIVLSCHEREAELLKCNTIRI